MYVTSIVYSMHYLSIESTSFQAVLGVYKNAEVVSFQSRLNFGGADSRVTYLNQE